MTTKFMEPGTAATYGFDLFPSTFETIASSTECANMAARSVKVTMNVLGQAHIQSQSDSSGNSYRLSWQMAGPDSNSNQISVPTANACRIAKIIFVSGLGIFIEITTSGKMQFNNAIGFTRAGTATVTGLTTPQNICVTVNGTGSSNYTAKLYVNGVLDITMTNADAGLGSGAPIFICIGVLVASGNANALYFSSIYVDDDSSNNDLGGVRVTAKLPSKLNTNNFDTLGGSGANRYDRVGERPLSPTNYIQHAATSDVQENFGIQGELEGDDNLCGAQIIARAAWAVAKRGPAYVDYRILGGWQSKTAGTTLTLNSFSGGAPSLGDTVLIAFASDGSTGAVTCTDNASTPNTYVVDVDKAAASPGVGNARVCIIRAYMGNVTSMTSITITHPSVTARAALAASIPAIQQSSPLDKTASAVGSSTSAASGATATTTQANEVVFGAFAIETDTFSGSQNTGLNPSSVVNGSWATSGSGAASNMLAQYQIAFQVATNTQNSAWSGNANTDWAAAVATYKCGGVGTPKLMNNGTEGSALTLTGSAVAYMNIADGGGYPNNPAAVGMRSSNDEPDTFMYECGMLIAYIPGPPTHHHHKWGPTFNPVLAQ